MLFLLGPNTCVPLGHICKKQGAVSKSSTEAEVIAMDACMQVDGLPALQLWEQTLETLCGKSIQPSQKPNPRNARECFLSQLDAVPTSVPEPTGRAQICILEDNEPVIRMSVKQRWPQLRYVPRTHRINLDWIFELVSNDPGVFIKWISTKEQLADILTKGMFTAAQFQSLVEGAMIGPKFEKSGANLVSNEVSRCCYAV